MLKEQLIHQAVMYVLPAVTTFIVGVFIKFLQEWKKKTNSYTLAEIFDIVSIIVNSLQQEFIDDIKKDGNFTKDEQIKFKNIAIKVIINTLDNHKIKLLKKVFKDFGSLEAIVGTLVEHKIFLNKRK